MFDEDKSDVADLLSTCTGLKLRGGRVADLVPVLPVLLNPNPAFP